MQLAAQRPARTAHSSQPAQHQLSFDELLGSDADVPQKAAAGKSAEPVYRSGGSEVSSQPNSFPGQLSPTGAIHEKSAAPSALPVATPEVASAVQYLPMPALATADVWRSLPTSTAHQARLQLYQPTRRPQWMERIIETPWGLAKVRGKLGQVHADIIEAICRHAEDYRIVPQTGHMQILVDPYRVRVTVGGGKAYSKDTMWKMLTELREASITLDVPSRGLKILGGILDRVEQSQATKINRVTGQQRHMWRVTLDPAFAGLLHGDLQLHYDPAPLAKIETGVAQAIARHILTHRDQPTGGWTIDKMIEMVGAGGDSDTMRNRRRDVHNSAASLKAVGILVQDGRLTRAAA